MTTRADERRLEKVTSPLLTPEETVLAAGRAWVARRTRLQSLLQRRARYLLALTERRVLAFPLRYWTRKPRRDVLVLDRAQTRVIDVSRGRRRILVIERGEQAAVIVYLGRSARNQALADALIEPPSARGVATVVSNEASPAPGPSAENTT